MKVTYQRLESLLREAEGENLEFKEAKKNFEFENLAKSCAALANEGGGFIVLGVTDKRPRRVVGTEAFAQPERTRKGLIDRLGLGVGFSLVDHPDGRVLIFDVPKRPIGVPIKYDGKYWARVGDELSTLSESRLRDIFSESGRDFSAEICEGASIEDLELEAIENFRRRWIKSRGKKRYRT